MSPMKRTKAELLSDIHNQDIRIDQLVQTREELKQQVYNAERNLKRVRERELELISEVSLAAKKIASVVDVISVYSQVLFPQDTDDYGNYIERPMLEQNVAERFFTLIRNQLLS